MRRKPVGSGVRRRTAMLAVLAFALVAAGCGAGSTPGDGAAGPETDPPSPDPGDDSDGPIEDWTMAGYIRKAEDGLLTVDEIQILSGDEAAAAREEDGEPPVEDGLDIPYLRNPDPDTMAIPVAGDVSVEVYDCSADCHLVDWAYDRLVAGEALPYGSSDSAFTVTVRGGEVVEIAEVYLP